MSSKSAPMCTRYLLTTLYMYIPTHWLHVIFYLKSTIHRSAQNRPSNASFRSLILSSSSASFLCSAFFPFYCIVQKFHPFHLYTKFHLSIVHTTWSSKPNRTEEGYIEGGKRGGLYKRGGIHVRGVMYRCRVLYCT